MDRVFIGVDPGKKGAFAVISDDHAAVLPWDEQDFARLMRAYLFHEMTGDAVACVEHVGAMPGQGVTSMFSFGDSFGYIRGVLTACRIPFELVRPQKWKKEFSITDKNHAIAICKRLFPGVSLFPSERSRKESDGMAEALLMAEFARRRL